MVDGKGRHVEVRLQVTFLGEVRWAWPIPRRIEFGGGSRSVDGEPIGRENGFGARERPHTAHDRMDGPMDLFGFRKVVEEKEARFLPPASARGGSSSGKSERKTYGDGSMPVVADGDVIRLGVSGRTLLEGTFRPD